jgi:hypothetical protein
MEKKRGKNERTSREESPPSPPSGFRDVAEEEEEEEEEEEWGGQGGGKYMIYGDSGHCSWKREKSPEAMERLNLSQPFTREHPQDGHGALSPVRGGEGRITRKSHQP